MKPLFIKTRLLLKKRFLFSIIIFSLLIVCFINQVFNENNIRLYSFIINDTKQKTVNESTIEYNSSTESIKESLIITKIIETTTNDFTSSKQTTLTSETVNPNNQNTSNSSSDHGFKKKNDPQLEYLRKLFADSSLNPKIKNKHFITNLLDVEEQITTNIDISSQIATTQSANASQKIIEQTKSYKPPKFFVILIQIHSRLNYFKELVESLRNTKYIEQTLVIFSHDVYDEGMNKLVASIDFCATLQIFYPYSIQIYPNEFPGQDPNDCPRSIDKEKAILSKCNNAYYPDKYGHYREDKVVQIKHHWLWKLSYTFEQLSETKNLQNLHILLLEEDYYLMPDSIHVLRKLAEKRLSDIDVVSLALFGPYKQDLSMTNLNLYSKAIWHGPKHNTGLMLSRAQWKMIKERLNEFCTYDDYNWDWSLQFISHKFFKLPLVSIHPVNSRVIHIGECGFHHKSQNCDPSPLVNSLKGIYNEKKSSFFPDSLNLNTIETSIKKIGNPNGGWSDPRDYQLCKSFANPLASTPNITIEINTGI